MLDRTGHVVREGLSDVFKKGARLRKWKANLQSAAAGLRQIHTHMPVDVDIDLIELEEFIRSIAIRLEDSLPHVVCQRCQGHNPTCDCKGRGWFTKSQMIAKWRKSSTSQTEKSAE